jgi:uncharacterized protein YjiS (DUF1127 family)
MPEKMVATELATHWQAMEVLEQCSRSPIGRLIWRAAIVLAKATTGTMDALARKRQRRELLSLSDRMLKDIGISRSDAEGEASKPSWQD